MEHWVAIAIPGEARRRSVAPIILSAKKHRPLGRCLPPHELRECYRRLETLRACVGPGRCRLWTLRPSTASTAPSCPPQTTLWDDPLSPLMYLRSRQHRKPTLCCTDRLNPPEVSYPIYRVSSFLSTVRRLLLAPPLNNIHCSERFFDIALESRPPVALAESMPQVSSAGHPEAWAGVCGRKIYPEPGGTSGRVGRWCEPS